MRPQKWGAEALSQQPIWLVWIVRLLVITVEADFLGGVLLPVIRKGAQNKK